MEVQDFIPTRGSKQKGIVSTDQVHSFSAHKSKRKANDTNDKQTLHSETKNEFDIKQAKKEVIKFGISGLNNSQKEEYKIQLAIKLGAKPPKNKYNNYAALLEEKKKKSEEKFTPVLQHLGKVILQKSSGKRRKNNQTSKVKKKLSIIENYGKVK